MPFRFLIFIVFLLIICLFGIFWLAEIDTPRLEDISINIYNKEELQSLQKKFFVPIVYDLSIIGNQAKWMGIPIEILFKKENKLLSKVTHYLHNRKKDPYLHYLNLRDILNQRKDKKKHIDIKICIAFSIYNREGGRPEEITISFREIPSRSLKIDSPNNFHGEEVPIRAFLPSLKKPEDIKKIFLEYSIAGKNYQKGNFSTYFTGTPFYDEYNCLLLWKPSFPTPTNNVILRLNRVNTSRYHIKNISLNQPFYQPYIFFSHVTVKENIVSGAYKLKTPDIKKTYLYWRYSTDGKNFRPLPGYLEKKKLI